MRSIRKIILLLIAIAALVIVVATSYAWLLGQNIYIHMYRTKSGVDFWATWTLENNIFTAAALLTLVSIITLPRRSTFISFLSTIADTGPTVKRLETRSAIIWRLIQIAFFFGFYVSTGGYSLTGQNVAFLLLLMGDGSISLSSGELTTLFALPFRPGTSSENLIALMPALEAYQLYVGLIGTFLFMSAGRLTLSMIQDMSLVHRDMYVIASKFLFIVSLVLMLVLLGVPMWTVNAGTWMSFVALNIAIVACIFGSVLFLAMRLHSGDAQQRLRSKISQLEESLARLQGELLSLRQEYEAGSISAQDYRKRVEMLMGDRAHISDELRRLKLERLIPFTGAPKRYGVLAVVLVVVVVLMPVAQTLYYGIPMDGDRYIDWKFNYETKKEIALTNWASGLEDMETQTLEDLTSNATPESEVESLTGVRQWDQTASYNRMKNQIGTNWMQLADSDIVYLRGHEYWIAPLSFDTSRTETSFINQRLFYTHTEGLVILDAFSGDLVENEQMVALLNRSEPVNMYYGEGEGFLESAFVNVPGINEVGNVSYHDSPDYVLSGFESTFFMLTLGPEAWSFMGRDMNLLVERNVLSRVNSALLQGLRTDSDPYIVVDTSGQLYYAVSVFIDYHLATGYANENYIRFLGVVLVDIGSGEMRFCLSPSHESDFFIDQTYTSYYDWEESPDWLQSQMKWPEDLYERQLDIAYTYHVDDGFIWKSGQDFHQTPESSDTRYIIMRIGGVDRFVAMHNSEFRNSIGHNLAGIYVMGCGDKDFGKLTFYSAGDLSFSTYLGPNAAVQAFETNDEVRTQLQLWGAHRYGNRLLYHLGGDLFFVIPVFLEVETSTSIVIEKLGGVGLVDAATGERVELGTNVIEAYYKTFGLLNQTVVEEGEVGFESAEFSPVTIDSGDYSSLVTLLRNNDETEHNLTLDIVVNAGDFAVQWHGDSVTPNEYPSNTTFRLNIGTVGPGDVYGTTPLVSAQLPEGLVFAQYIVKLVLRTEEGIVDEVTLFLSVT